MGKHSQSTSMAICFLQLNDNRIQHYGTEFRKQLLTVGEH